MPSRLRSESIQRKLRKVVCAGLALSVLVEAGKVIPPYRPSKAELDSLTPCQAHQRALEVLDQLRLDRDAHLHMQKSGGLGMNGLKAWESTSWSLSSLPQTLLSLPSAILTPILSLFSSPSPSSSSHSSNYLSSTEKSHLKIKTQFLSTKEEAELNELLEKYLKIATERPTDDPNEEDGCGAWATRGLVKLIPPRGMKPDIPDALHSLQMMVGESSDAASQYLLGFLYASGFKGVEQDQSSAILHYTMAALQGLPEAEMTLAFRYWMGIGVKEDCMRALDWYENVAHKSFEKFISGPPGGLALPLTPTRLSDLAGGVYGMGASVASTGAMAKRPAIKAANSLAGGENYDDVLQYYQYHSDRSHHEYSVNLGRIHYVGSVYSVPGGIASGAEAVGETIQSFPLAKYYFSRAAHAYWLPDIPKDPKTGGIPVGFDAKVGRRKLSQEEALAITGPAALAAAYLGRMYLRGEGVEQDYMMARLWLKRSSDLGEKEGHNLLGLMFRDGLGVPPNLQVAKSYFQAASQAELAEAKVQLGKLGALDDVENEQDPKSMGLYTWALGHGNPYEAYYHLGLIHAKAARTENALEGKKTGTCGVAVSYLKNMVERGCFEYDMMGEADAAWKRGERVTALIRWWIASEMGYEVAQNNVAFIMDQVRGKPIKSNKLSQSPYALLPSDNANIAEDPALSALAHWIRSANQQNIDSLVKVGDYYYDGIGVANSENRFAKAAGSYQSAADTQASAVAFWNLGWMYENGLGVVQDWHLAKRYYDLCSQTDSEAEWPIMISLINLYVRSWWAQLMGGKQKHLSLFGLRKPIQDGMPSGDDVHRASPRSDKFSDTVPELMYDEDLVAKARNAERDELEDPYDDFIETGRVNRRQARSGGGYEDEEDDGDFVAVATIGLLIVGTYTLVWYRGRIARRQEERQAEERQAVERALMRAAQGHNNPLGVPADLPPVRPNELGFEPVPPPLI